MQTDPRIDELLGNPTINEQAMAWSIRRALYTLRLANGESRKVLAFLNREVYPSVIRQMQDRLETVAERGPTVSTVTDQRLGALARTIRETLRSGYEQAHGKVEPVMKEQAVHEADALTEKLNATLPAGVTSQFVAPSVATLRAIVFDSTFNGDLLRNWFADAGERSYKLTTRAINVGMAQGRTTDEIVRAIRGTRAMDYENGVLEGSRRDIETLVRTSVRNIQEEARRITYAENDDIIDGYIWVATLDSRTCPICMALDGERFDNDQLGRKPPAHPNCRCTTTPIVKGLEGLPPGQRASAEGPVPDTMTYGEWLKKMPKSVQEDILGVRKADLFRTGRFDIGDFVDARDKILTLDQLQALEAKLN